MISSITNPKVKYLKSLVKGQGKAGINEFVIEGIHIVEEALSAHISKRCEIKLIVFSKRLSNSKEGSLLFDKLSDAGITALEASEKIIEHLSDVKTPQGLIGLVEYKSADFGAFFEEDDPIILILDGIQDPGNLGAIIRSASAFGISGILLSGGTVNPFNQKVIRSTAGTIFNVKIIKADKMDDTMQALKRRGIKLIATTPRASKLVSEADLKEPVALIIGSEGRGINENILKSSDEVVSIPMSGEAESLNAAVSASIILYEALRQRKGM